MKISLLKTHSPPVVAIKLLFLLGFLTTTVFGTVLNGQCNPGEIEISSVCACDDGSGNVTLSVEFLNFPSGCVDGYDIGITYSRANPPGGTGSVSVMGVTSSPVTFPAVSDIGSPSDIGIISVVSNASCGSASLPICTETAMVIPTTGGTITTCAADQDVNTSAGLCSGVVPDLTGQVMTTGGCNVTVMQSPAAGTTFGSACGDTQVVTFTMNDGCGTVEMCSATLTLVDNQAPSITGSLTPTDVEACDLSGLPAAFTTVAEIEAGDGNPAIEDNCTADGDMTVTVVDDGGIGSCPIVFTRTYTIDDNCGNTATISHVINVDDTMSPAITGSLMDANIEGCDASAAPTAFSTIAELEAADGDVAIEDVCTADGDLLVTVMSDGGIGTCPIVMTRTYTITDQCGNSSSLTHIINIDDTVSPEITGSLTNSLIEGCDISDAPAAFTSVADLESADGDVAIEDVCTADVDLVVTNSDNVLPMVGCTTKLLRTYTITDECGNTATLDHLIDILDTTPPQITGSLTPSTLEGCNVGDAPTPFATVAEIEAAMGDALIEDNCTLDGDLMVSVVSDGGTGTCPTVLTRTYTISDACSNTSTINHEITIEDTTDPTFVAPPENIAASQGLSCGMDVDPHTLEDAFGEGFPEVVENCLGSNVTPADFYNGISAPWDGTATEVNGITISYSDDIIPHPEGICSLPVERKYRIRRTWTIVDACGNSMTSDPNEGGAGFDFQRINVIDGNVNPTAVAAAGTLEFFMDASCETMISASEIEDGSFDNCGIDDPLDPSTFDVSTTSMIRIFGSGNPFAASLTVTSSDVDFSVACPFTLTIELQVEDECGNIGTTTKDVTISDNTAPEITGSLTPTDVEDCDISGLPAAFTTVAELEAAMGDVLISDFCVLDGDLSVSATDDGGMGTCPIVVTRTYTVSDYCGNSSSVEHVINIDDTTPPMITGSITDTDAEGCSVSDAPTAFTSVAEIEAAIGDADVTDVCTVDGDLVVTVDDDGGVGTCPIVLTRTYTVADGCGNTSTIDHIINIDDTMGPEVTGTLDDDDVDGCDVSAAPSPFGSVAEIEAAMGDVEINDACTDDASLLVTSLDDGGMGTCPIVLTRTYTVEDECGNTSTLDHVININAPELVINCPMDMATAPDLSQADANLAFNDWLATVSVTGGCNPGAITNNAPATAPDVCTGGSVVVEFSVSGDCDTKTCTAEFTVPAATLSANPIGGATVCISSTVALDGSPMAGSGDYSHSWVILPASTGTGTFSDPSIQETNFTALTEGIVYAEYTVTDNISGCTASGVVEIVIPEECEFEFQIDDPCVCNNDADVNTDNGTFMELIVITGPDGAVLPNGQTWSFTELTGAYSPSPFNEENMPGPQGIALVAGQNMTYCGLPGGCTVYNSASGNQLMAPFGSYYLAFAHVDAEGYCGTVQGPSPDMDGDPTTAEPGNEVLSICNTCLYPNPSILNMPSAICIADSPINIQGTPVATGVPTWNGEATFTGGDPPYAYVMLPGLTDNGDGTATFDPQVAGVGTHIISYTFEDQSALGTSEPGCFQAVQSSITVSDLPDASWTAPGPFCYNDTPNPTLTGNVAGGVFTGNGVVFDDGALIGDPSDDIYTFDIAGAGIGNHTICYTINDVCVSTECHTINVYDNPPILTCPADTIVDVDAGMCTAVVNDLAFTLTDDCDASTVTFEINGASIFTGNGDVSGFAFNAGTSVVTYNAIDANGNAGNCDFLVIVNDNEAPNSLACPTDNVTLACGDALPAPTDVVGLGVMDNCTAQGDLSLVVQDVSNNLTVCDANLTILRTYIVEDESGNESRCTQTLQYVQDVEGPGITAPANLIVACGDDIASEINSWLQSYTGLSDNCTNANNVLVNNNYYFNNLPNLCDGGTLTVDFTAVDDCGNETVVSSDIIVEQDVFSPTFVNCPSDITVGVDVDQCDANVVFSTPVADDCNGVESVVQTQGGASGTTFPVGTTLIEFTATDSCGNTSTCTFNIVVEDTDEPLIFCPSNDVVQCTDAGVCTWVGDNSVMYTVAIENCPGFTITHEVSGATTVPANTPGSVVGTTFEKGTSIVTYTIMDANGNPVHSCSFNVIVEDCEDPMITCPSDIAVDNDAGLCGAVVVFDDPITSDNCPLVINNVSNTFNYTGAMQEFVVPAGVTQVNIEAYGAKGGDGEFLGIAGTGGSGGRAYGELAVTPGDVLYIYVGEEGQPVSGFSTRIGSFNGGGVAYGDGLGERGSGGGASDVRIGGTALTDRIIVAGGGGGACCGGSGGNGGGLLGGDGAGPNPGLGGNQFLGGLLDCAFCCIATPGVVNGALGQGGGVANNCFRTLAGGGGGYYGGSAGNNAGGGSSYIGGVSNGSTSQGGNNGEGYVIITYDIVLSSLVQTEGLPSGSLFPVGTTTNTFVVTDGAGNTASCSFDVTVTDAEMPMLTCPANVNLNTDNLMTTGDCAAQYEWTPPMPNDNCGLASYKVTYTNPDNTVDGPFDVSPFETVIPGANNTVNRNFDVGTTTVVYSVEDIHGNTNTCSFDVIVADNENPSFINCPDPGFTLDVFTNDCETGVFWSVPLAEDNCGANVTIDDANNSDHPTTGDEIVPGDLLPPGTYTVAYLATDAAGNTDNCQFIINVLDTENPIIECPSQSIFTINGTNPDCEYLHAGTDLDATVGENCDGVTVTHNFTSASSGDNTTLSGHTFPLGNTTVVWTATDASGNSSVCSFVVTVEDDDSPIITCPSGSPFNFDNDTGICGHQIGGAVLDATATDNCTSPIDATNDYNNLTSLDGAIFPVGTTDVIWTAIDDAGNESSCTIQVVINDVEQPAISCIADVAINTGPNATTCDRQFNWQHPLPTDNCGVEVYNYRIQRADNTIDGPFDLSALLEAGAPGNLFNARYDFPVGTSIVRYFTSDEAGNIRQCNFSVTVTDNTDPVFVNCPDPGFTLDVFTNDCETSAFWDIPIAEDNCEVTVTVDSPNNSNNPSGADIMPGDILNPGVYTVAYIAADNAGNTASCMFNINVIDTEDPMLTCPTQSVVTIRGTDENCEFEMLTDAFDATYVENCNELMSLTHDYTSASSMDISTLMGHTFPLGNTTVTWTAEDTSGNTAVCSFIVTVEDDDAPIVTCPVGSPFTFDSDMGECSLTILGSVLDATATDNCTDPIDAINDFNNTNTLDGAVIPVGTTVIIWTAIDDAGNRGTCEVTINVEDNESPVVDCTTIDPMNPQMTEMIMCENEFAWSHPLPTDNCDLAVYTYQITNPDGTVNGPFTLSEILSGGDRETEYAFEEGTSTVAYFVEDVNGNTDACSFDVTVVDDDMPYFADCPTQIIVGNDPDQCSAQVNWVTPHAFDNCTAPLSVLADPANAYESGDTIPVGGPYTIVYTATDNEGNVATCDFDIFVNDTQEPEILVGKPQNETVACDNVPLPLVLNENDVEDNCTDNPLIEFNQLSTQDPNPAVCDHYNYTLTNMWTVSDETGNAQEWEQIVTVQDIVAPVITVPADMTVECTGPSVPLAFMCDPMAGVYAPDAMFAVYGLPSVSDNCAPEEFICIEFTDVFIPGTCGFTGVIERTWTATDPCGNTSDGVQVITIVDTTAPEFTCMNITAELDEMGMVSIGANDVIVGGVAAIIDDCTDPSDLNFQMSQTKFGCDDIGVNEVELVVTDDCGNSAACLFEVTVEDNLAPAITCPKDVSIQLDAGECRKIISDRAQASDNCSFEITYSPDLNDFLEIGETTVTATATDPSGNSASCTFQVNIYEFIPATNELSCNNNINLSLGGDCTATINADMILEGNNYRCYDNYCVTIETTSGIPHDNYFTLDDVGQTFKVSITDCMGSNNSCWGYVLVEEKLIPEIECPEDVRISCNQDANARDAFGQLLTGEVKLMTCEPSADVSYEDDFVDFGQCENPRGVIYRTWRVTDNTGNEVTCVQSITIEALELDNVKFPDNLEGVDALTCIEVGNDASLTEPENTGYPTLNEEEINLTSNLCMTSINYSDERFDICNGSFEILRTWKVRNMCLPLSATNPLVGVQLIKVLDVDAPKIGPCPKDTIISTHPWSCTGELELPIPTKIEDVCSNEADFDVAIFGGGRIETSGHLGAGTLKIKAVDLDCDKTYTIRYQFIDPCGNIAKCTFDVTVVDRVGPVASAKRDVVVSLTAGGPGVEGTAKLYVENLDNYSYDNCSDVYMEIRRDNAPACGNVGTNGHNNNNTFDDTNHNADNINDTDDGQFVKFCCEDLTAIEVDANGDGNIDSLDIGYVQVFLRVWDDGNKSGIYGDVVNGQPDNFNETWSFVKVENKLPPIIVCPDDATIYCDWGIDVSSDFGGGFQNVNQANFDKTGVAVAYSTCGAEDVYFNDNINLNECGVGTIIRQFEATTQSKTGEKKVRCQQVISVLPRPTQFSVIPPNPTPLAVGCELTQDDLNKRLPTVTGGVCDVIGENVKVDTFLFENGVCKKWVAEYNYHNWCTDETMGPYYAFFIYEDTEDPVIDDCEDKMFAVGANCETVLTLTNSATDGGGCIDNGWLKWQLYVDTWGDGTVGHFASSFVSPSVYRNWRAVASTDPILPQGHVYNDVVWVKYIEPTSSLDNDEVSVTLDKEVLSGNMSNHKVSWKVTDGCHNYSSCSYNVMVVDKKKPTPYCVSLSSALMADGTVELWARDFDKGSFDNCTVQDDLWFTFNEMSPALKDTIIRVGNRDYLVNADVPQYFDENGFVDFDGDGSTYPKAKSVTLGRYNSGDIQRWVPEYKSSAKVFDCDEYAVQGPNGVDVKMSVWDAKCNTDYCTVYLTLLDNQNECDASSRSTVSGEIRTEKGDLLMDVQVTLTGDVNDLISTKIVDGTYEFNYLPHSVNYTIEAEKNKDYMNGISTLDLVLIQRHILGLQELESEYKLIAADVNKDMNIRASDLVELRKLILGVTDKFTAPSWQFVDADDVLTMNTPLDYVEVIEVNDLQSDVIAKDFMAVKVGDVNGNAKANLRSQNTEPRSGKTIFLLAEEQLVSAGEMVSLDITSSNFNEVFGYQFTAQLNGLQFKNVQSGAIEMTDANIGVINTDLITTSWNADELISIAEDEVLFTLNFIATDKGMLSEMIQLNSDKTTAESYTGANLEVSNIDLVIRNSEIATSEYVLHQNEPNPFKDVTTITYEMVESGTASFTFYDATGKVVLVKNTDAQKGLNSIEVKANEFNTSGIIYYQLEASDFTATKKMLIIK